MPNHKCYVGLYEKDDKIAPLVTQSLLGLNLPLHLAFFGYMTADQPLEGLNPFSFKGGYLIEGHWFLGRTSSFFGKIKTKQHGCRFKSNRELADAVASCLQEVEEGNEQRYRERIEEFAVKEPDIILHPLKIEYLSPFPEGFIEKVFKISEPIEARRHVLAYNYWMK